MIPRAIVENTKKLPHWDSLIGERDSGSQWGRAFTEKDFELDWEEVCHDDVPNGAGSSDCRYFRLRKLYYHFPDATVGAIALSEFSDKELRHIRVRYGKHGLELYTDVQCFPSRIATQAWCIVGWNKSGGLPVIYTAHPGEPLQFLSEGIAVKR